MLAGKIGYFRPTAFTPLGVPNLYCWLDASDSSTVTLNSGNVSQWRDKSGGLRHFSQSTSAAQPAYTSSGLNGLNCITFNGSHRLGSDSASTAWSFLHDGTGLYDLYVVWRTVSGSTALRALFATGNSSYGVRSCFVWHDTRSGSNNTLGYYVTGVGGTGLVAGRTIANLSSGTARLFRATGDPANATQANRSALVVGASTGTNDTGANATASAGTPTFTATIGSLSNTSQFFGFSGVICEIVIYNGSSAVSSANRTAIQNYLIAKWGL